MTKEDKGLVKYWFRKAEIAMRDGKMLLRNRSYESASNRFYYAAFYAARAVLATKNLDSSKHRGVLSLFQIHFVKTGLIEVSCAKALRSSFEIRLESDYGEYVDIASELVLQTQKEVSQLLSACKTYLKSIHSF